MPRSVASASEQSEYVNDVKGPGIRPPSFTSESIKSYFVTRFTTLTLSKEERAQQKWLQMFNPFGKLKYMTLRNWNYFMLGFLAWTWDMFDYCAVALNVVAIADTFDKSVKDITWGITLVLMLRSVGAFLFGWWGDRYGRKWPCIVNLSMLVVLQIATGFTKTYEQFLGTRALFGISMGGIYGFALATALDDSPVESRGGVSGIFQMGGPFGYLSVLLIIWRYLLPETDAYVRQKADADAKKLLNAHLKWYQISDDTKAVFKRYWLVMIYCVILMASLNFMHHGALDLFPTFLTKQLEYSKDQSAVTNSVAKLGAMLGGATGGHVSTFVGRRLTIMLAVLVGGAMIYPWMYLRNTAINAGVFFLQMAIQGAWGVVPCHLSELSPPANRALVVGLTYQLGNLIASGGATIMSGRAQHYPIKTKSGKLSYNYSKVISTFMACIFACVFVIIFLGPENRGAAFDANRDKVGDDIVVERIRSDEEEMASELEKPQVECVERAYTAEEKK